MPRNLPNEGLIIDSSSMVEAIFEKRKIEIVKSLKLDLENKQLLIIHKNEAVGIVYTGDVSVRNEENLERTTERHLITKGLLSEYKKSDATWLHAPYWIWPIKSVDRLQNILEATFEDESHILAKSIVLKIKIKDIDPAILRAKDDKSLLDTHLRLHQLFALNFAGNDKESANDLTRDQIVTAEIHMQNEFERREFEHKVSDALTRETAKVQKREPILPLIHIHNLDRDNKKTEIDGVHIHAFLIDGHYVSTEKDGAHEHPLFNETANNILLSGAHRHLVKLPDGDVWTEINGDHIHQLQVWTSAIDGIHSHRLILPNNESVSSLGPGEYWDLRRNPTESDIIENDFQKVHDISDVTLATGTRLINVQVWDPKKIDSADDKAELAPIALFELMDADKQFTTIESVLEDFASDELLKNGIFVEPKYNGFRVTIQKDDSDRMMIFDEEAFSAKEGPRNTLKILDSVNEELKSIKGPFILDAELVAMDERGDPLPRKELARFKSDDIQDDAGVIFKVSDALFLPELGNTTQKLQMDRRSLLAEFFKDKEFKHLEITPTQLVVTESDLVEAIRWAGDEPWSEGARLKSNLATYSLGSKNDLWTEIKTTRSIFAIIHDKKPADGLDDVWQYSIAIGPISKQNIEIWEKTLQIEDQTFTPIGITADSAIDAKIGDVIEIDVIEFVYNVDEPRSIRLLNPAILTGKMAVKPNTIDEVTALIKIEEKRFEKVSRLLKFNASDAQRLPKVLETVFEMANFNLAKDNPFIKKGEQRMILGINLEPEVVDAQDDIYSEHEVRRAAELAKPQIGYMHREKLNGATLMGDYIAIENFTIDGEKIKKGTWLSLIHISGLKVWRQIQRGDLTGLSIGGFSNRDSVL